MGATSIEWTDATWNPVRGCSRVSPGCEHCYAETMAARFSDPGQWGNGFAERTPRGARWTRKVQPVPGSLLDPLHWRKPRRVFVNSTSDLFHEDVPDEWIDRVLAVTQLAYWHTYQILTKRAARMALYFQRTTGHANVLSRVLGEARNIAVSANYAHREGFGWPYHNLWLGVSVEDQERADERIPHLLRCPARVRFLSCEPLLGKVDLGGFAHLDWVIVGGESGPGARPFHFAWARSIRDQCRSVAPAVPVFMKQIGARPQQTVGEHAEYGPIPRQFSAKGGDFAELPEDLRVREWPIGYAR